LNYTTGENIEGRHGKEYEAAISVITSVGNTVNNDKMAVSKYYVRSNGKYLEGVTTLTTESFHLI